LDISASGKQTEWAAVAGTPLMLLALIPSSWLAVVTVVSAVCRAAASADGRFASNERS
jgi:hypothetical protein